MIKIVPDANVILSGMLTQYGLTRKIVNLALAKKVVLFGSTETYKEFCEKIKESRLKKYLVRQLYTSEKIIFDYRSFVSTIEPYGEIKKIKVVTRDPEDDAYLKVAKASNSKIIITRDRDLLDINKYEDIFIRTPEVFIDIYRRLHQR